MAFYESPRFPERISMQAKGGPAFSTSVVTVESGREKRNSRWAYPRQIWDVSHSVRSEDEYVLLRAHFMTMNGKTHGFRFKDFTDYEVGVGEGVVDGLTTTTFQLVKIYTSGAQTKRRRIRKPIATGFILYNSGTPLVLTTDYTLNTVTGIVTTVTPKTAANLTWVGEFDVPMRYDTDRLDGEVIGHDATGLIYRWDSIPVVEDPNA